MKQTAQKQNGPKIDIQLEETIATVRMAEEFRQTIAQKVAEVTGKAIKRKRRGRLAQMNKKRRENRPSVFACIFGESDDYYTRLFQFGR